MVSGTGAVRVLKRVQLDALGARVIDREQKVPEELALNAHAPQMGIRRANIRDHVARARDSQRLCPDAPAQRSEVICLNGEQVKLKHRICRRVLNHVKGDVSKVPFISDPVTSAKAGLAVAKDVPCEAEPGSEVVPILLPESANGAQWRSLHVACQDAVENVAAQAVIVVGVFVRIFVVLNAEIFPPYTQVEGQPAVEPPRILSVERKFVVAVAAREVRSDSWRVDTAGLILISRSVRVEGNQRVAAELAGEFPLRINRNAHAEQLAVHEAVETSGAQSSRVQCLHSSFVSPESAVVLNVYVGTAKAELM